MPSQSPPTKFTQWRRAIRRYLREFHRSTVIYIIGGAVIVVLLILTGLSIAVYIPTSRAIKAFHARRLANEAMILIDHQQWPEAATKIHDAFVLRPSELTTQRAAARLLTKTGQGSTALTWWKQISATHELSIEDRRDYASAAISASELSLAATQIELLRNQKGGPGPIDLCLEAQLATLRGDAEGAIADAEKVLQDKQAAPEQISTVLAVVFLNSSPDSPPYNAAFDRLVELARNDNGVAGLDALRLILRSPPRARLTDEGIAPLSIASSKRGLISRKEVADRLDHHPDAKAADHLSALEVRLEEEPNRAEEFTKEAIRAFGKGSDDNVAALTTWLYERGEFETVLKLVPAKLALSKRELFVARIDALAAVGNYAELETLLLGDNAVLDPTSQYIYLAVVQSKLGETPASQNEWERALQTVSEIRQFLRIGRYAEVHGFPEVADSAYKQALVLEPRLRVAHLARLRLAEAMGHTADAHKAAAEIVKLWPDDTVTRLHNWYLQLLLGGSPAEMAVIEKDVEELVSRTSLGADASATLALARLQSGRPAAALSAFTFQGYPVALGTPNSRTMHAAALAANGWKDKAREEAKKLAADRLLPEERQLLTSLLPVSDNAPSTHAP